MNANDSNPPTIQALLAAAGARLAACSDSPGLDAELLLAHCLDKPRSHLRAWPEACLNPQQANCFAALLARRADGEPVAHLLGEREFWSLPLQVTPATLIPRPETELLVEQALLHIPADARFDIVDLGTGSGAIALALARERPHCRVTATDNSAAALAIAAANAARLGLAQIQFRQGDWFAALEGERFDIIVSNPPYIAAQDPHLARGDVRFEPRSALVAGADGLADLRRLITAAPAHLNDGGWLLVEHGYDQQAAVSALFHAAGLDSVQTQRDLNSQPRVTCGRLGN